MLYTNLFFQLDIGDDDQNHGKEDENSGFKFIIANTPFEINVL